MYPDYRTTFPLPEAVKSIEFGAGKGYFGKVEFPNCFLTDLNDWGVLHASEVKGTEFEEFHHLDGIIDYFKFNFEGRKFDRLIFCNPFLFGFKGKYETIRFLNRAKELLFDNGEIYVLGQKKNGWVNKHKTEKWVEEYNSNINKNWSFTNFLTSEQLEDINSRHIFRKSTGETIFVNIGFTLKFN